MRVTDYISQKKTTESKCGEDKLFFVTVLWFIGLKLYTKGSIDVTII